MLFPANSTSPNPPGDTPALLTHPKNQLPSLRTRFLIIHNPNAGPMARHLYGATLSCLRRRGATAAIVETTSGRFSTGVYSVDRPTYVVYMHYNDYRARSYRKLCMSKGADSRACRDAGV